MTTPTANLVARAAQIHRLSPLSREEAVRAAAARGAYSQEHVRRATRTLSLMSDAQIREVAR